MRQTPLVSVIVLGYRNYEFLFECLESVLCQTYQNMELIVSNDASEDFKVKEVTRWLQEQNAGNIKKITVNQNPVNLGTVRHYNFTLDLARGEIIKLVAADDALYDEKVIQGYVDYFLNHSASVVTSQYVICDETLSKTVAPGMTDAQIKLLNQSSTCELYRLIAQSKIKFSLGVCMTRAFFDRYGSFNETYRIDDDWPTWLKAVRMGCRIHCLDQITLKYRSGGITSAESPYSPQQIIHYVEDLRQIWVNEILPNKDILGVQLWKDLLSEHVRRDEWSIRFGEPDAADIDGSEHQEMDR